MLLLATTAGAALASALAIVVLARLATPLGLMDHPGGRRAHAHAVPLVGGLAIFASVSIAGLVAGIAQPLAAYFLAASLVIAIGAWDDIAHLSARWRFVAQLAAALVMVFVAGVELRSVGDLLGVRPIGLWIFGIPLTVFAVVGVVNAMNMIDGLDGLAGSIALFAFAWYAAVAATQGQNEMLALALLVAAAVAGFLAFNLRLPWQPHARVFLGDAGSLFLGLTLAWYAVDLTQGAEREFPPIAALWVVLLPLADCVSLMVRRLRSGRSPFVADRAHIHHYLLARGWSHTRTLATLVGASALCGAIGFFGWRWGAPEPVLFWTFFGAYFAYHWWIQRAWKALG